MPRSPADPLEVHKRALLDLLVEEHQGLWSLDELDRHLQPSEVTRGANDPSVDTEDAIQQLADAGLAHRIGPFAFATRAAIAGRCLAS